MPRGSPGFQIVMPEPLSAPCNLARAPYKNVYSRAQNALCWQDTQTYCSSVNRYFVDTVEVRFTDEQQVWVSCQQSAFWARL